MEIIEIVEARYCESKGILELVVCNIENKYSFRQSSVIDLTDAKDVASANGFKGKVKEVAPSELHKRPA